jgi:geranylgeranylglycerol-phosphate geranylgeranyltransferase
MIRVVTFAKAYLKSMRLYYSFITGIAGLLGLSYYQFVAEAQDVIALSNIRRTVEFQTPPTKSLIILCILFMAWGINQIINDYLGLKEDRINAPARPMVTGELNPVAALTVSAILMIVALLTTWFYLEKAAVIPLIIGVLLNIVYEYAKGYGLWGNVVFGIMISTCGMYGFMAAGPSETSIWTPARISMLIYIAMINGLMTFYTYFKDYEGDKASGKKTIIVRYGLERSKYLSILGSFLPTVVFVVMYFGFNAWPIPLNGIFLLLAALTVCLQVWTGYLFYKNPKGEMTYYSLSFDFRSCACCEAALMALFNPVLGIVFFFLTYMFIGFLFNFHINRQG